MEKVKKVFGDVDLTWKKIIIFAIIAGIYTAIMSMLPIVKDTSFSDITVTFEIWILFGIFIIMNSKSAKDSALKCFAFFLISQPLVYLIQDVINRSNLFVTYYRFWFIWTIATIPMGFIGLNDWVVHAIFNKAGNTEVILESPSGEKTTFNIKVDRNTYTINKKKGE